MTDIKNSLLVAVYVLVFLLGCIGWIMYGGEHQYRMEQEKYLKNCLSYKP